MTGQKRQLTEQVAGVGLQGDGEIDGASNAEGDDGGRRRADEKVRERPSGGAEA